MLILLICLSFLKAHALTVVKYEPTKSIQLKIIRAEPDSFETYTLINHNGREMTLVCAGNRVYDDNKLAFIEYRNFYQEIVARFTISENKVCEEIGRYIENVHSAISPERPFLITLHTKSLKVDKIIYPKIDPFADEGKDQDLLPRKELFIGLTQPVLH
jgi:hypothetical protein